MRPEHIRDAIVTITLDDASYPAHLRTIFDPPSPLYVRGELHPADESAIAIVGARRATAYGIAVAEHLAGDLARRGITVVSGMARGIDAAAHRGALVAGGRTIAVLGCGADVVYPPEHAGLMEQIIGQGAVMSEFAAGIEPRPGQFPRRNRIISGISLGVVVVEGRLESGALITADAALEQGREVFAVPGRITDPTAAAPHRLLQQGAKLICSVSDILDELRLPALMGAAPEVPVEGIEALVLSHLDVAPQHVDQVALRCGRPVAVVNAALATLECKGLVAAWAGARYSRRDIKMMMDR